MLYIFHKNKYKKYAHLVNKVKLIVYYLFKMEDEYWLLSNKHANFIVYNRVVVLTEVRTVSIGYNSLFIWYIYGGINYVILPNIA